MDYKYSCVIEAESFYKTFVLVELGSDEQGEPCEIIQHYTLHDGETLIDTNPPSIKLHAGADGFVCPRWDGKTWTEGATPEEIAVWELDHSEPPPMPPTDVEILQEENRLLRAQVQAATERQDFVEDCIAEIAAQVYKVN